MSSPAVRQATRKIAEVARKTAAQMSPLVEVTVLSRNPDGSLNVSDGRGGCARLAAPANYRVGQKLRLGVEPAIGQQTNLQLVNLSIEGSALGCPDDQRPNCGRLIGVQCLEPATVEFQRAASVFAVGWVDPPPGLAYPGRSGDWKNRLSSGGDLAGGPNAGLLFTDPNKEALQIISRRTTSYPNTTDPYADQVTISTSRFFLDFDTSGIPAEATILGVTLRVTVKGNTPNRITTDHSELLRVVPSTHDGNGANLSNWDKISGVVLGAAKIGDLIDAGPNPVADTSYPFEFALDPGLADPHINRTGRTKLAIVMQRDADKVSVLPTPGLFTTGRETTPTTPTNNDQVHVATGSFVIDHITYVDASPRSFPLSQLDHGGQLLVGTESYIAALVQLPGNNLPPIVVKGAKGQTPRRPTIINEGPGGQVGGIILSWITIGCQHGNPSLIGSGNIIEEPTSRPYANLGNPNEIRSARDWVLFENTADVLLLVTYGRNISLS